MTLVHGLHGAAQPRSNAPGPAHQENTVGGLPAKQRNVICFVSNEKKKIRNIRREMFQGAQGANQAVVTW